MLSLLRSRALVKIWSATLRKQRLPPSLPPFLQSVELKHRRLGFFLPSSQLALESRFSATFSSGSTPWILCVVLMQI